jgi:peptide deformylase
MPLKDIVYYGNPILRKKCKDVSTEVDLSELLEDMWDSMYESEGIGLAANQIGVNLNVFIIDISHVDDHEYQRVFLNGEILESEGESVYSEGCLSLPDLKFDVTRPEKITFRYWDENRNQKTEKFEGLLARAIQHEIDHLNGILMIDRISETAKIPFLKEIRTIKTSSAINSKHKTKPQVYL